MAEPEQEQPYEYVYYGKTDGRLENIPKSTCKQCGDDIEQPLPTGLWLHVRGQKDYTDSSSYDHEAEPSTLLESLLVECHRHMYADVECQLHRKYWSIATGLSKKDLEKIIGEPSEYGKTWYTSIETRVNSMAFRDFVKSKEKYLKRNKPLPKAFIIYHMAYGRNYAWNTQYKEIKRVQYLGDPEVWNFGWEGRLVKCDEKLYVVVGQQNQKKESAEMTVYNVYLRNIRSKDRSRWKELPKVVAEITT